MTGFTIQVIPGYQRMNQKQREALLALAEAGLIKSPVHVGHIRDKVIAVDRDERWYLLKPDGTPIPLGYQPTPEVPNAQR